MAKLKKKTKTKNTKPIPLLIFTVEQMETHSYGKGSEFSRTGSQQFNHKALGQLTNQSTFCISEGGVSLKQELTSTFETDWEVRCCNNVKYVKNYTFLEQSRMKINSSTH